MLTCQHCMGTGQPNGVKGGPEHGLCGFCGGTGSTDSMNGDHPLVAEIAALRQELEAVKREAVEVCRPLVPLADAIDEWRHEEHATCLHRLRASHLRAARAFMEKHGNG